MSELIQEISPIEKGNFTNIGFSIICAYNDYKKLEKYLIRSLSRQQATYELLTVENQKGLYSSATPILNQTAHRARYDFLLFVHQDVAFLSDTWLIDVQAKLSSLKNLGAIGVAGKTDKGLLWASVIHGDPPTNAGSRDLQNVIEVQTLDGCLIIVPRIIFERIPFDESHPGWYLYIAGYCLDLLANGYKSYVVPDLVYHESTGLLSPISYEEAVRHLIRRHKSSVETIYTTVGEWKTNRELESFNEQLAQRDQFIHQLKADLAKRDQDIYQLKADLAERDQDIYQLKADLAEREQFIHQLKADLAEREQFIHQLKADLAEREQEVLSYALSNSWRITKPLRRLWKLWKGKEYINFNH
jgi:Glycosyltransferase like family